MLKLNLGLDRTDFKLQVTGEWPVNGTVGIYGPSGAGKTALLRCIAGLEPAQGTLHFRDQFWSLLPTHRRALGYVFQEARLLPHLSVADNLRYAWRRRHPYPGLEWDEVIEALSLKELLHQPAPQLSGGQAQRVALGRALLSRPQLLLLDEPLAALDSTAREPILELLETLPQRCGLSMIHVSHSLEEIQRLSDYLVLLRAGTVAAAGPTLEVSARLDLPLALEDNAAALLRTRIVGHCPEDRLTELTLGDGQPLWLSGLRGDPGQELRLRIPARDISLALSPAPDSSILNILRARVDALRDDGDARMGVRLQVADQWLLARVTRRSARHLQLTPGATVYAQIKSVALLSDTEAATQHA